MAPSDRRFQPIVYVRGFAMSQGEVDDTVADPYMGFNLGSTKIRTAWTGDVQKIVFESPVVRLMKDYGYVDVYSNGEEMPSEAKLSRQSIVIYRYYDLASSDFGDSKVHPIAEYANGLYRLLLQVRARIEEAEREAGTGDGGPVRFYLVAHSMGGLVVRAMLQNEAVPAAGTPRLDKRDLVDKVFTYATPHNGIDMRGVGNVPSFVAVRGLETFNRDEMARFLGLKDADRGPKGDAHMLAGAFDASKVFCLVGTNSRDYTAASGLSSAAVGPFSDGLVRMDNAFVCDRVETLPDGNRMMRGMAPRAFVHRAHSGHYGIVNSEEGYQNLTRFLFGDVRVDGHLAVKDIRLPRELEGKSGVRASYQFEVIVGVRGKRWDLSRRLVSENSAVFRKFDDLTARDGAVPTVDALDSLTTPHLFTVFLSRQQRVNTSSNTLGFSIDLGVQVPEYEVEGVLWLKKHFPGGYLFRDKLNLIATPPAEGSAPTDWSLRYGFDSHTPNAATKPAALAVQDHAIVFSIPIANKSAPGIDATLLLTARRWNQAV